MEKMPTALIGQLRSETVADWSMTTTLTSAMAGAELARIFGTTDRRSMQSNIINKIACKFAASLPLQ